MVRHPSPFLIYISFPSVSCVFATLYQPQLPMSSFPSFRGRIYRRSATFTKLSCSLRISCDYSLPPRMQRFQSHWGYEAERDSWRIRSNTSFPRKLACSLRNYIDLRGSWAPRRIHRSLESFRAGVDILRNYSNSLSGRKESFLDAFRSA